MTMSGRVWRHLTSVRTLLTCACVVITLKAARISFQEEVQVVSQDAIPAPHVIQQEEPRDLAPDPRGGEGDDLDRGGGSEAGFHQVNNQDIFIYSGFLDLRHNQPSVRMFGIQAHNVSRSLHCTYSEDRDFKMEAVNPVYDQWPSPKVKYLAYEYVCPIPKDLSRDYINTKETTLTVGLHAKGSEVMTSVEVTSVGNVHSQRNYLAVCVKAIWGSVDSLRLVEWIEFNRLLGAEKIVFYDSLTLGSALKVLEYYIREGFVEVIPFTLAQKMSLLSQDDPMRRQLMDDQMIIEQAYLVSMNDCYYRHRDHFKYMIFLDIDEIITPFREETLVDVIDAANAEYPAASAFNFQTAWHLEEYGQSGPFPQGKTPRLHMQHFLHRSPVINSQPKAIIDTDRAVTINWHGAVTMPSHHGLRGNVYLPWKRYGYVHHFRKRCKHAKPKCDEMSRQRETDDIIPRYRRQLEKAVAHVIQKLHLE